MTSRVHPVRLPTTPDAEDYMYSSAFVAGWGVHDRGGAPSNTLKAAELTVIPAGKSRACSGQVRGKNPFFYVGDYRKQS